MAPANELRTIAISSTHALCAILPSAIYVVTDYSYGEKSLTWYSYIIEEACECEERT